MNDNTSDQVKSLNEKIAQLQDDLEQCNNAGQHTYEVLYHFTREVIGFAVNARKTWDDWQDHQDIGMLYALAKEIQSNQGMDVIFEGGGNDDGE